MESAPSWHRKKWKEKRAELIKKTGCCEWCGSTKNLCIHHPQKNNSLSQKEYESLKGTIVLCKRCHHIYHKYNKILCQKCKKHYHSVYYSECWHCAGKPTSWQSSEFDEDEEAEAEFDNEYRKEWCGKCEHHQIVDQKIYCKLHPSKECPNSMFIEESIIRRFYELPLHD